MHVKLNRKGKNAILAIFVVMIMAIGAIPIALAISDNEDQTPSSDGALPKVEPYGTVTYYNGTTPLYSETRYNGETVEVRFDAIPADEKIFLGWSRTQGSTVADYYTGESSSRTSGTSVPDKGGSRTFIMGEEDVILYAVWAEPTVERINSSGSDRLINVNSGKYIYVEGGSGRIRLYGTSSDTVYLLIKGQNIGNASPAISIATTNTVVVLQFIGSNTIASTNTGDSSVQQAVLQVAGNSTLIMEGRQGGSITANRNIGNPAIGENEPRAAVIGGMYSSINSGNMEYNVSPRTFKQIQIEAGTVNANSTATHFYGAGIGGGQGMAATVIINGGTVSVNLDALGTLSSRDGVSGAGIGGGAYAEGNVTINGGTVTVDSESANRAVLGAGIGGGRSSKGIVTITGGSINVRMEANNNPQFKAAAIGGGGNRDGNGGSADIYITGGTITTYRVKAYSGTVDIGKGYNGASETIRIDGGSISVSSSSNALQASIRDSYGNALQKYIICVKEHIPTGSNIESVFATINGVYTDINVNSFHVNRSTSQNGDYLYLYLPVGTGNDVSLEYGSDGKAWQYTDITASPTVNHPENATYYRVVFISEEDKIDNLNKVVAVKEGETIVERLQVKAGKEGVLPLNVYTEVGGSTKTHTYVRNLPIANLTITNVTGKTIIAASAVTEWNVTYIPDPNGVTEGVIFGDIMESVYYKNQDLKFTIGPDKNYRISEVQWRTITNQTGGIISSETVYQGTKEYTLPAANIDSDVTITIITVPIYYVEYDVELSHLASNYVLPPYVDQGDDLEFTFTHGTNYRINSVKWEHTGGSPGGDEITPVGNTYTLGNRDFSEDVTIIIDTYEVRMIEISVDGSYSDLDIYVEDGAGNSLLGKNDINIGDSLTVYIGYNNDPADTHRAITLIMLGEEGSAPQSMPSLIPTYPNETQYTFTNVDLYWSLAIMTADAYFVDYTDDQNIDYYQGIGSPDIVVVGNDLEFEIHAEEGFKISDVWYLPMGDTPLKLNLVTGETNIYILESGDMVPFGEDPGESTTLIIRVDTIESYKVAYTPKTGIEYSNNSPEVDEPNDLEFEVNSTDPNLRIVSVEWKDTKNNYGSLPRSDEGKYVVEWGEFKSNVTISVTTVDVWTVEYTGDINNVDLIGPTYVINGATLSFEISPKVNYRISAMTYEIGGTAADFQLTSGKGEGNYSLFSVSGNVIIDITTTEIYTVLYTLDTRITWGVNNPNWVDAGTDLTFTVTSNEGYMVSGVKYLTTSSNGDATHIADNTFAVSAVDGHITLTATVLEVWYLQVTIADGGIGTVKISIYNADTSAYSLDHELDATDENGAAVTRPIPKGAEVRIEAVAEAGYKFNIWSSDEIGKSVKNPMDFTITENTNVTAYILPEAGTVEITIVDPTGGEVGLEMYEDETYVGYTFNYGVPFYVESLVGLRFTAIPDTTPNQCAFAGWVNTGIDCTLDNPLTYVPEAGEGPISIEATFEESAGVYLLTVRGNDGFDSASYSVDRNGTVFTGPDVGRGVPILVDDIVSIETTLFAPQEVDYLTVTNNGAASTILGVKSQYAYGNITAAGNVDIQVMTKDATSTGSYYFTYSDDGSVTSASYLIERNGEAIEGELTASGVSIHLDDLISVTLVLGANLEVDYIAVINNEKTLTLLGVKSQYIYGGVTAEGNVSMSVVIKDTMSPGSYYLKYTGDSGVKSVSYSIVRDGEKIIGPLTYAGVSIHIGDVISVTIALNPSTGLDYITVINGGTSSTILGVESQSTYGNITAAGNVEFGVVTGGITNLYYLTYSDNGGVTSASYSIERNGETINGKLTFARVSIRIDDVISVELTLGTNMEVDYITVTNGVTRSTMLGVESQYTYGGITAAGNVDIHVATKDITSSNSYYLTYIGDTGVTSASYSIERNGETIDGQLTSAGISIHRDDAISVTLALGANREVDFITVTNNGASYKVLGVETQLKYGNIIAEGNVTVDVVTRSTSTSDNYYLTYSDDGKVTSAFYSIVRNGETIIGELTALRVSIHRYDAISVILTAETGYEVDYITVSNNAIPYTILGVESLFTYGDIIAEGNVDIHVVTKDTASSDNYYLTYVGDGGVISALYSIVSDGETIIGPLTSFGVSIHVGYEITISVVLRDGVSVTNIKVMNDGTESSIPGIDGVYDYLICVAEGNVNVSVATNFRGDSKTHYITSYADPGATISPLGEISVIHGRNATFHFQAVEGYVVSDVIVDGKSLSQEEIDQGYYTFRNVVMNHTIVVKNTKAIPVLTVEIAEGKGYVEYSINGGSYTKYDAPVTFTEGSDIRLKAYADEGYSFDKWTGTKTSTEPELYFEDQVSLISLEVSFKEDGSESFPWWIVVLIIIILLVLIFLLWRRGKNRD